jgi:hypothetical protein
MNDRYGGMGAHLFVGLGEFLVISLKFCSKSLPIVLFFIPALHTYVPVALDVVVYHTVTGMYTHLMEFASEGMASVAGRDFGFLADVDANLSSGFLFFSSIAIACSSHKLRGTASVGIVPGSCVSGLCSAMGPRGCPGRGGFPDAPPSTGTILA